MAQEGRAAEIVALIASASRDPTFKPSLEDIYEDICQHGSAADILDPLNMIPILLDCPDEAAGDLLSLMGKRASAKEVVIGVQEQVEKLKHRLVAEDFDEEILKPIKLLIAFLDLYASALPRLKHRNKPPQETMRPILTDLMSTMSLASSHASTDKGRYLLSATAYLSRRCYAWVQTKPDLTSEDLSTCENMLKDMLDQAVLSFSHCIQASLADRTFFARFPRLGSMTKLVAGWHDGVKAIYDVLHAYSAVGMSSKTITASPSTVNIVLVAHLDDMSIKTLAFLSSASPFIVSAIQSNVILDECLSLLLEILHSFPNSIISPDVSLPLCTVIPSLASAHPSPSVRHHAFRILSMLLSSTDPQLRLQILQDLCSHSEFPQMRAAAVGLVKEAVLSAFTADAAPSLFASPRLLQVLGPIVFRPNPQNFFDSKLSMKELKESSEPPRLVECLSLLYVLLLRDEKNKTGIWDRDNLKNLEKQLFSPMRTLLTDMLDDPCIHKEHAHDIIPLVSLKLALERVESVISSRQE